MSELWRDIVGYEGIYLVSDAGNLKRIGKTRGAMVGRILKCQLRGCGYLMVMLYGKGKPKPAYVHDLVAAAFIGEKPKDFEVNHIDLNKNNNHLSNLEYVTPKANRIHASQNGAFKNQKYFVRRGESHRWAKLRDADVENIRLLLASGRTQNSIAVEYGVTRQAIWQIKQGNSWKPLEGGLK